MIPTLSTGRLTLRGPTMADFDAFAGFYGTPRAADAGGPLDRRAAFRHFAAIPGHWLLKGFGWWMIDRQGKAIGFAGLHNPLDADDPELGWALFEGAEGHGYAQEAVLACLDYARLCLKPRRLISYIVWGNAASERPAGRVGAVAGSPSAEHPELIGWVHTLGEAT